MQNDPIKFYRVFNGVTNRYISKIKFAYNNSCEKPAKFSIEQPFRAKSTFLDDKDLATLLLDIMCITTGGFMYEKSRFNIDTYNSTDVVLRNTDLEKNITIEIISSDNNATIDFVKLKKDIIKKFMSIVIRNNVAYIFQSYIKNKIEKKSYETYDTLIEIESDDRYANPASIIKGLGIKHSLIADNSAFRCARYYVAINSADKNLFLLSFNGDWKGEEVTKYMKLPEQIKVILARFNTELDILISNLKTTQTKVSTK